MKTVENILEYLVYESADGKDVVNIADVRAAMQEYAELIAFDFQKFRKNRLGFAFTDERLKAEFEEYKKQFTSAM